MKKNRSEDISNNDDNGQRNAEVMSVNNEDLFMRIQALSRKLEALKMTMTNERDVVVHESNDNIHGANKDAAQVSQLIAKLPRGGWIKNLFDELVFRGKSDKQNPMSF